MRVRIAREAFICTVHVQCRGSIGKEQNLEKCKNVLICFWRFLIYKGILQGIYPDVPVLNELNVKRYKY